MTTRSFDTTADAFDADVIAASHDVPVIVDFWAPWCAPCRVLKPVLEELAAEYGGKFRLAKVNIDEHPRIAARYDIRSIPHVKAFAAGEVVDEFAGALPESGVRAFVAAIVPAPSEQARRAAAADLAGGDFDAAEAKLREALALDEQNHAARADLAEVLVARGEFAAAEPLLDAVPELERDDRAKALIARVAFWKKGRELPDAAILQARINANPTDSSAKLELAARQVADGAIEAALALLIEVVRNARGAEREAGRKAMLDTFAIASDGDLVARYRRLLASALN